MASAVRLKFGTGPDEWDRRLYRLAPWAVVYTLLPWLLALTQVDDIRTLAPTASWSAGLSAALLLTAVVIAILVTTFVMRARAEGVLLLGGGVFFLCPVLETLSIALGPMASGGVALATVVLALWCFIRLWIAFRAIAPSDISRLSTEIITSDGHMRASGGMEGGGVLGRLLRRSRPNWFLPLELALPVLVLVFLPGTLNLEGDAPASPYAGALAWFLWTELFLLTRPLALSALLRHRALREHALR